MRWELWSVEEKNSNSLVVGMWLRDILPDKIENREAEGLHTGIGLKSGV